jgi:hypothetical protein
MATPNCPGFKYLLQNCPVYLVVYNFGHLICTPRNKLKMYAIILNQYSHTSTLSFFSGCGSCTHSTTQNTTWVAYKALTTPWGWQPYAETCRGRIWNILIKIHYFLEHLLFFLQTILQDARFNHQHLYSSTYVSPSYYIKNTGLI